MTYCLPNVSGAVAATLITVNNWWTMKCEDAVLLGNKADMRQRFWKQLKGECWNSSFIKFLKTVTKLKAVSPCEWNANVRSTLIFVCLFGLISRHWHWPVFYFSLNCLLIFSKKCPGYPLSMKASISVSTSLWNSNRLNKFCMNDEGGSWKRGGSFVRVSYNIFKFITSTRSYFK